MTLSNSLPFRHSRNKTNEFDTRDEIIEIDASHDKSEVLKNNPYFWPSEIKKNDSSYNSVISNNYALANNSSLKNINSQIDLSRQGLFSDLSSQPKFLDRKSSYDFGPKRKSCLGVNYSFQSNAKPRLTRGDRRKQC